MNANRSGECPTATLLHDTLALLRHAVTGRMPCQWVRRSGRMSCSSVHWPITVRLRPDAARLLYGPGKALPGFGEVRTEAKTPLAQVQAVG